MEIYGAIDLKSFYASVECVARGLDPLKTNLVVAGATRTEKSICLAVTPLLKTRELPGKPQLFEAIRKVRELNAERVYRTNSGRKIKPPCHWQGGFAFPVEQ